MQEFSERVAVITGAAREGMDQVLADRNEGQLEGLAEELVVTGITGSGSDRRVDSKISGEANEQLDAMATLDMPLIESLAC